MSQKQQTIKNEISLLGVGLHTGKKVRMTFKPAPINHGYAFTRLDLEGHPIIEATANYVVTTQRGTNLEKNGVQINTSEHVLAAAYALGIDNQGESCMAWRSDTKEPLTQVLVWQDKRKVMQINTLRFFSIKPSQ